MIPRILLVNPPIYDFAAFDFWSRPYGLLSVAGFLRGKAHLTLFDYLDRPAFPDTKQKLFKPDAWGRGRFPEQIIQRPKCLAGITRYFRRFGRPRKIFHEFLTQQQPTQFVFIQTMMTYWYPGVAEVIEDIRKVRPATKIVLGGNYASLCPAHAKKLHPDLLIYGDVLEPLWSFIDLQPDLNMPALWDTYQKLDVGVLKLSDGCPFNCTYCSVPKVYDTFKPRSLDRALAELDLLCKLGAKNIAFYDDALLFNAEKVLIPFLEKVRQKNIKINFHSPNALNARFITKPLADAMTNTGFKTFYLGFESCSEKWQKKTGSKVLSPELATAVEHLKAAGAQPRNITAYQILGHPLGDIQQLEDSMRFVNSLGILGMLADFSPIPGTPDGEFCRKWVDLDEPLMHNKTAFPIITMGFDESNRLKDLQRKLNRAIR